jgi:cohesin loading factor subunit SCC2
VFQVSNFVNKGIDMSLRVASLDYLGVVAARLRKDAVLSQLKLNTIDQIINEIRAEEQKEVEDSNTADKKLVTYFFFLQISYSLIFSEGP